MTAKRKLKADEQFNYLRPDYGIVFRQRLEALKRLRKNPERVPQIVATAVGVREQSGRALVETLAHVLQSRELLLLLDNCEHLVDSCAHLAGLLLSACPAVRILATSRGLLGMAGETTFRVPPLALPPPEPVASLDQLLDSNSNSKTSMLPCGTCLRLWA